MRKDKTRPTLPNTTGQTNQTRPTRPANYKVNRQFTLNRKT